MDLKHLLGGERLWAQCPFNYSFRPRGGIAKLRPAPIDTPLGSASRLGRLFTAGTTKCLVPVRRDSREGTPQSGPRTPVAFSLVGDPRLSPVEGYRAKQPHHDGQRQSRLPSDLRNQHGRHFHKLDLEDCEARAHMSHLYRQSVTDAVQRCFGRYAG